MACQEMPTPVNLPCIFPLLTISRVHFILVTGESQISRLSGGVHTPVWPQAFMGPVGHYDHPVRRQFHEGRQFLALYRQRGCVPFRRKRKGHKMNDSVVIVYNGEQVSVPREVADFLEQDRKREQAQEKQDTRHLSKSEFEKRCCPVWSASSVPWRMRCSGTSGLKICGRPLRNWMRKVKTCSPSDTAMR